MLTPKDRPTSTSSCYKIPTVSNKIEKFKIIARHESKLNTLIELKKTADAIEENLNDTITNLSGRTLSHDVLRLGLGHGLATRPKPV